MMHIDELKIQAKQNNREWRNEVSDCWNMIQDYLIIPQIPVILSTSINTIIFCAVVKTVSSKMKRENSTKNFSITHKEIDKQNPSLIVTTKYELTPGSMQSIVADSTSRNIRLVKSILMLIPLLGVHFIAFSFVIGISTFKPEDTYNQDREFSSITKMKILLDCCLSSFEGMLVSLLFCFFNNEVRSTLKREMSKQISVSRSITSLDRRRSSTGR